jgi:predicted short-subunit dehydrogenase-like oxidoreductase (DUF2520 family)
VNDSLSSSVAIAGAGPVAQSLGYLLARRGHAVRAVASRSRAHAERAALWIGGGAEAVEYEDLGRLSLPTIVAVSDSALPEVARRMASTPGSSAIVVHTCGAAGADILEPLRALGWACGVLHPLQTVPTPEQGIHHLVGAVFGVGGDQAAVSWADALVQSLGGRSLRIRADRFPLYHAAAVLAGNGMFALLEAATSMMAEAGLADAEALDVLGPLCRSSLSNALLPDAAMRLTGPVARGDVATVEAHLAALSESTPEAAALYTTMSAWLLRVARQRGLRPGVAQELNDVLERRL